MAQAATISREQYKVDKTRISADFKADKAACAALSANAKDICVSEAKAKEVVARAELKYSYSGKAAAVLGSYAAQEAARQWREAHTNLAAVVLRGQRPSRQAVPAA